MIEISLNSIKKSFGFKYILDDINFEIKYKERVAIIGDNGCGKSTILNIICGLEIPDKGNVSIRKNAKIAYLVQQPELIYKDSIVKNILYESNIEINETLNKLIKLEQKMIDAPSDLEIINKYINVQEKYMNIGGYEFDTFIDRVCFGLKLYNLLNNRFNELSGGEQKRVLLASLILKNSDILVLDEPTNHLDIDTIEWLENFINEYDGTVLIVSHDRYFLDKVASKIILIENGKSIVFNGNYSKYLELNEERIEKEFEEYKEEQKLVSALKKKIKQLQEFGRLAFPGGESFFKRAESIRKRLEKIELKDKPIIRKKMPIKLEYDFRSGKDVVTIKDYDLYIQNKLLIKNIDINICYGEKVCLIGSNGCGKSTLIKEILSNNSKIKLGANINIGYIPQQISFEKDMNVLEYARTFYSGEESHLRSALDKFYFHGEFVFKKINKLSGGEKVRLKLFELISIKSNFIILDEPTNHIDIYTKEILEESLKEYKGTLLFVSHDRYFINEIANKILYVNNNTIKEYNGNYDYFNDKRA